MADIRCPMCGKLNPEGLEVCQFCQARLKPLIAPSPPENNRSFRQPSDFSLDDAPIQRSEDETDASLPDWLRQLRTDEPQLEEEAAEIETDWLSDFREDSAAETQPSASATRESESTEEFELPDWLTGDQPVGEAPEDVSPEPETDEFELPDWLTGDQPMAETPTSIAPEAETADWFQQPLAVSPEEELPSQPSIADLGASVPTDIPDWLAELAGAPETTISTQPEESAVDWLARLAGEPTEEAAVEAPQPPIEETLDQLVEISPPPAPEVEPPLLEETSLPEWLIAPSPTSAEALPDWLLETESASPLEEMPEVEIPPSEEEALLPAWLADESVEFGEPAAEDIDMGMTLVAEELPSAEAEPLYPDELPEWLAPEVSEEIAGLRAIEAEAELTPAELPGWLEAMRPVESVTPAEPAKETLLEKVEGAGPLAGLRGVLPAEPEIARIQKPPAYSLRLEVSENQRKRADLLKNMLERIGEPLPFPQRAAISSQHILRGLIALILILAILWPVITASQRVTLPAFLPETEQVNTLIGGLPENARVLLAFDYQPGLIGEMDAAASAVVDHLMLRGAYLTIVSTSPAGPILAEHFLREVQISHNYISDQQYVNLGYIPGGSSGLLSFAESPRRALPLTTESRHAWGGDNLAALPPLQGISHISDFSLIIVIVDDPDTARSWIEQVQPYLVSAGKQTPLAMIISAQAEPLVRPYYQATPRQVQGFVTGLRGGASYAKLIGRAGLSRQYWDAFNIGLIVATLLITVGGLINIGSATLAKRRPTEKTVRREEPVKREQG